MRQEVAWMDNSESCMVNINVSITPWISEWEA
jgi:hypothetical protein